LFARSQLEFRAGKHAASAATAAEALRALTDRGAPDPDIAPLVAELHRVAGAALIRLGRVSDALPQLETAVDLARAHLDRVRPDPPPALMRSAAAVLLRALLTLGVGFATVREVDAAIEMYTAASAVAASHPQVRTEIIDDVLIAALNLAESLRERAVFLRSAGEPQRADEDIAAAGRIFAEIAGDFAAGAHPEPSRYCRAGYLSGLGHQLLLVGRPADALRTFEELLDQTAPLVETYGWIVADAHAGKAQALLDLASPDAALVQCDLALATLAAHEEPQTRIAALRVRSSALHALGRFAAAYEALEAHYAERSRLEALNAQRQVSRIAARIGIESARAAAVAERRTAERLVTLGDIGRRIAAELDADKIVRLFAHGVMRQLDATAVTLWRIDAGQTRLRLQFGVDGGRAVRLPDIPVDGIRTIRAAVMRALREERGAPSAASVLIERLVVGGRVLGVVSVHAKRARALGPDARSIVRTLAGYTAIALDNATAYAELEHTAYALQTTHSELTERTAEFERLSTTDALTGLADRRHLRDRAQTEIAQAFRAGARLAVAIFDLDHFKHVNDTYGHAAGDTVLVHVARIAQSGLRPADVIARIGGEEFALLLPGAGDGEAIAIAERIRSNLAGSEVSAGGATVRVTASFGVATLAPADRSLEDMLLRADAALYRAKQSGRNRVLAETDTGP
jgi:diguanylate cyclase (GGDEF)-like protein